VDKLPFVSCICLTYNRAPNHLHLIGEAVESYLRQTYPADRRQLLILNDTPGQELEVKAIALIIFSQEVKFRGYTF
jgi:glycosyltransferase involved in cell wall biosynthesis